MITASFKVEHSLWNSGKKNILGIDEVGRGSWAGPLVVAGVIFPKNVKLPQGIADSKKLSAKKRQTLSAQIKQIAKFVTIAEISHTTINQSGLAQAIQIAFKKIAQDSQSAADFYLVDAFSLKNVAHNRQLAITKGDEISASIAAASIVAKVYRDNLMQEAGNLYPAYNFAKNKGYGTRDHQKAIKQNGFCQIHRTSFNLSHLVS